MDVNSYFGIKNLTQVGLHKMINDENPRVREVVAGYIDQPGLHKMIGDSNFYVRGRFSDKVS